MFSWKKNRDGERGKDMERGSKTSVPSPASLRDGRRPASKREERQTPSPEAPCPSELRLVLLGRKGAGKSSAGNTILGIGERGFTSGSPTEECLERWANVAGRRVVIIDTPGWEWYYPLNGTPEWVKWETVRSVTLSPPGPHALLLVVRACASVDETYRREIQEHMELLGAEVWKHTLVLFTQGDNSEELAGRIHTGRTDLKLLVEKCGNRWHVLNSKTRGRDAAQVVELLQKVEKMEAENGGALLEMEQVRLRLEQEDRVRWPREGRRSQRLLEERKLGESLREIFTGNECYAPWREEVEARWPPGRGRCLLDLRVVLLGERDTGKSLAGNAILGETLFQAGRVTEECSSMQGEAAGRRVTVVDTPGWESKRTPERVKHEIRRSVTLCPPGPHALLLVVGLDSDITVQAAMEHMGLLGEEAWRYALVLFTGGDKLRRGVTIEPHVQSLGKAHQLVERCKGRYHVISGMEPMNVTQVTELLEKVEDLVAGNGGQPFTPLIQEIKQLMVKKEERWKNEVEMKDARKERSRMSFERKSKERERMEGKSEMGRQEEEERRQTEMRKLFDKRLKMEIQEMKEKNDRIMAILDQEYKLREGDIKAENKLKIEEKEMEIKALIEKKEEIEIKVFTAERELNQERRKWEEEREKMHQDSRAEREELEKTIGEERKKNSELMEITAAIKKEVRQNCLKTEEELRQIIQNKTTEIVRLNQLNQENKKALEDLAMICSKSQEEVENLKEKEKDKDLMLDKMKGFYEEQSMKTEAVIKEKTQKHDLEIKDFQHRYAEKEREWCELHRMYQDKENEVGELQRMIRVGEHTTDVLKQDFEKKQRQREDVWRAENEKLKVQMDEAKEMFEKNRKAGEKEIGDLREKYEKMMNIHIENEGKLREHEKEIRQTNLALREKDKEMKDITQHYEEKLRRIQLEQNEEKERDAERNRQTLEEGEARLEIKDRRISELLQQVKEQVGASRKREDELEEKIKGKERELEEMRDRNEHYERQIAKLEIMIKQLKTKNAEMAERIQITEKDKDEIKQQNEEKELQRANEIEGVVREKDKEIKSMKMELNELLKKKDEKERKVDELRYIIEEREEKITALQKKNEEDQKVREEEWKDAYEKMQKEMEENKQKGEEKRQMREVEIKAVLEDKEKMINALKQKYDESEKNLACLQDRYVTLSLERDREIEEIKKRCEDYREEKELEKKRAETRGMEITEMEQRNSMQKRDIEEMEEINEKKDKEMKDIIKHYEEELRKLQLEIKLKNEEKERETEKSTQTITERDAQLQLKDIRISELMDLIQENEKIAGVTEKRLNDELRKSMGELEEKIREKVKEGEEMREKYEHSERHAAKLDVMIKQLRTDTAELVERIHIIVRERDEIILQNGEKELQREEEMNGVLREKDTELKDMRRKLNELQKKIFEKEREVDELRLIIQEKEEQITYLQTYEEQKKNDEEWRDRYEKMLKEIEEIKQVDEEKRQMKEVQIEAILEEKDKVINELKQEYEDCEKNLICLRERCDTLSLERDREIEEIKKKCEDYRNEKEEQRKWAEMRETELRELKTNYEKQRNMYVANEKNTSQQAAELREVEGALRAKDKEMEQLKKELKESLKNHDRESGEVDETRGITGEREEEMQKYEEGQKQSNGLWKDKYEKMDREMNGMKQIYEEKLKVMETGIKEKERCYNELKKKHEGSEKLLVSISEEYEDTREQVEKLEELISQRETDLEEITNMCEDYKKELEDLQGGISKKEWGVDQNNPNYPEEFKNKKGIIAWTDGDNGNGTGRIRQCLQERTRQREVESKQIPMQKKKLTEKESLPKEETRSKEEELMVTVSERETVIQELKKTCEKKDREIMELVKTHEAEINKKESEFYHKLNMNKDQPKEPQLRYTEKVRKMADMEEMHKNAKATTEQRADCKERSFQNQAKAMSRRGELRIETELNVSKPFQTLGSNKPAAVITDSSPEQPPSTFSVCPSSSELRLVLLGESWASKSSAGNCILGECEAKTGEGMVRRGQAAGRRVTLVEVTGPKWYLGGKAVGQALERAALCSPGPHAFLLVIPAYLSFTASYSRAVRHHMATFGKQVWKYTVVLFTWAEALGESIEQHILRNEGLRRLVHKCGNRYHTLNSWRNAKQVSKLLEKVAEMVESNHGKFYTWGASEKEDERDEEEREQEEEGTEARPEQNRLTETDGTVRVRKEWSEIKGGEKKNKDEEESREVKEYRRIAENLGEFSAPVVDGLWETEYVEKVEDQEQDQELFCRPPKGVQTPMRNQRPRCSLI